MKKYFLLTMASLMTVFAMAIGRNDGSTEKNAIDFDWDKGVEHPGGPTPLYYRVDLAPLYDEDNPSLTLYLTNPSRDAAVDVSMEATVFGQTEKKDYTIGAHQYKTYTANAMMLVSMKQTEITLALKSNGKIKLSAKVFEAADLDETCKDAQVLKWNTLATQTAGFAAWWKVDLKPVKNATKKDAKITITNIGTKKVVVKAGQSMDCPSSGLTKRNYELAPGEYVEDTVPQAMITSVQPDEIYFSIENEAAPVSMLVELVDQPAQPIIDGPDKMLAVNLHVTDTFDAKNPITPGTHLFRISVADMDSMAKYEPEFTYRNEGSLPAKVSIKMAFVRPAYGTSNTDYDLAANGGEEIVVYKKNMLEGMDGVDSIYLLTTTDQPICFYGRFKHVREGKACKTNIDFNWKDGHSQEARTTQWYAVGVADARDRFKDIVIYLQNEGEKEATVKASMAFSCPYIDLQEATRKIAAKSTPVSRRMIYSSYAMMNDTIYIGLETDQPIKFWADTVDAETKAVVDHACESAIEFDWKEGVKQLAGTTVWYKVKMDSVRNLKEFPTVSVQNLGDAQVTIESELSLECPDSLENEKRTLKIAANGSYTNKISRNMFENIVQDEIYLRVKTDQDISLQMLFTEKPAGSVCESAIPFNWVSGNKQEKNANVWYSVDLHNVMKRGNDLKLHIRNTDNEDCKGVIQLAYQCPIESSLSIQEFKLGKKAEKSVTVKNSALETLEDSVVYINLQGTTALYFKADTLKVVPFDTIYSASPITELHWDVVYKQTTDTAWYIIPKSEIDKVREGDIELKPVAHLKNLGASESTIKVEGAFAFPIGKQMMGKTQTVKAGKEFTDTIPASTFEQILKKDSILLRITRKPGAGDFEFSAELIKANTGNKRSEALPIRVGETFTQEPNTTMWYKFKSADWKKKDLIKKRIKSYFKNLDTKDAKVSVAIYEGLLSEKDMLETFGMGDYREQKIKQGMNKSRDFPAQSMLALANVEMYIQVTTDAKIEFRTKLDGEYDAIVPDPKQQEATLLVPNVDYVVPGDGQSHWYQICLPYVLNNYKYTHACAMTYQLDESLKLATEEVTIEVTSTFQDTMDCKMPVRSRKINTHGKKYNDTIPLSNLLSKATNRFTGRAFDISTFQEAFIDSMLHRYITSDSVTLYLRIKSSADVKTRLDMPKVTGDDCLNFQEFDWEHGVVNEKKTTTWYRVVMDSLAAPKKDLKLHLDKDKWSTGPTMAKVHLFSACDKELTPAKSQTLKTDTARVFKREVLNAWGWTNMMLEYYSDSVTHVWAEWVDPVIPDTIFDTIPVFACSGETYYYTDKDGAQSKVITADMAWDAERDSLTKTDFYIYKVHYDARLRKDPTLVKIESLGAAVPVVKKGAVPDTIAATKAILDSLQAEKLLKKDTVKYVGATDSIAWEYTTDGETWKAVAGSSLATDIVALRYTVLTECGDVLNSAVWVNTPAPVIVTETACADYTWLEKADPADPSKSKVYTKEGLNTDTAHVLVASGTDATLYRVDSLRLTITRIKCAPFVVTECKVNLPYSWRGKSYSASTKDTIIVKTAGQCDSIATIDLTVVDAKKTLLPPVSGCNFVTFNWGDSIKTYTKTDTVVRKFVTTDGCDSLVSLPVTISVPAQFELDAVAKYGNRLLMINRNSINKTTDWNLEELGANGVNTEVVWWRAENAADTDPKRVGEGYYLTNTADPGEPLVGIYWAVITLPAPSATACGQLGYTKKLDCTKVVGKAPALMPNLVRPGESIRVVNLDPDQETTIRVYTTEGLIQSTYTVRGEESFTIKAANEHGFYMVELRGEDLQSTLRYIVK